MEFLTWYKQHTSFEYDFVLNVSSEERDSTKFYTVNFPETERYLQAFTETGMVSNKYTNKWREYFKECEQYFIKHPENEGPPAGFYEDFVLFSQDAEIGNVENLKFESKNRDAASVQLLVKFPSEEQYTYYLTKYATHWMIDDIQTKCD